MTENSTANETETKVAVHKRDHEIFFTPLFPLSMAFLSSIVFWVEGITMTRADARAGFTYVHIIVERLPSTVQYVLHVVYCSCTLVASLLASHCISTAQHHKKGLSWRISVGMPTL